MKKLDSVFNECIMNAINSVVNCLLRGLTTSTLRPL